MPLAILSNLANIALVGTITWVILTVACEILSLADPVLKVTKRSYIDDKA